MTERFYTTSTAFLEALAEAGVQYIFANLGSDHPGLIEALAQARADGSDKDLPRLIVCPHEMVALSAAHAAALVSRSPQAVIVHVDAGTQNMGGAISNALRGRAPVLVFAGAAPYTMENELPGGRNEFIHWIQDVHDQRGIMRGYVKYDNEIRYGSNVKQLVHRALQIAASEPPARSTWSARAKSWNSRSSPTPSIRPTTGRSSRRPSPKRSRTRSPGRSRPPATR